MLNPVIRGGPTTTNMSSAKWSFQVDHAIFQALWPCRPFDAIQQVNAGLNRNTLNPPNRNWVFGGSYNGKHGPIAHGDAYSTAH
jgi:hypothetical protein